MAHAASPLLSQLNIPVSEVDEVAPTVVNTSREGDVDEWAPLRPLWFSEELHPCLVGKPVSLARVARDAGADDILPGGLATAVTGQHVVDVEIAALEESSAILAGVFVPLEHIVACELHLFFRKTIKDAEDDDPRDADPERDALEHLRFRI